MKNIHNIVFIVVTFINISYAYWMQMANVSSLENN